MISYRRIVFIFFIICCLPVIMGFVYSLLYSYGLTGLMSKGFTLEHWRRLWAVGSLFSTLTYSFYLTATSLFLSILIALIISWEFLHKTLTARAQIFLILPLLMPPLIVGFSWYQILSPSGVFSRSAMALGAIDQMEQFPRLVNDRFSIGIIISQVFMVFPVFTLLFTALSKREHLSEYLMISGTLGATKWQSIRRIYLPIILNKSRAIISIYGLFLLGSYEVPLLLGRSSPQTISIFIVEKLTMFNLNDLPLGHAMIVSYCILLIIFMRIFIPKNLERWV